MKVKYCETWSGIFKEMRGELSEKQAKKFFDNDDHFDVVILNDEDIPTHFIGFYGKEDIVVGFLDEELGEKATYTYQVIKNHKDIDPERLFLSIFVIREKNNEGTQIKGTAYNPIIMVAEDTWEIQHNLFCEEVDFIKQESSNFYTKQKVDLDSLYKDLPVFGHWIDLISNSEVRFLDE